MAAESMGQHPVDIRSVEEASFALKYEGTKVSDRWTMLANVINRTPNARRDISESL